MKSSISESVLHNLQTYFDDLDGECPANMYEMVLSVVEKPMLEVVMQRAEGNQSKAAQWLGLNRNTLRKKLLQYGLAD
jgi:Fis family transcriptional regulator